MKKVIFTETQIKRIVDKVIKEQTVLKEQHEVLRLGDLAELTSRMGLDEPTMLELFQDAFRNGGDEEVEKVFFDATETHIKSVGKGRYVVNY